jgi:hypothetical protein
VALLQLESAAAETPALAAGESRRRGVPAIQLAECTPPAGAPVWVIGHGLLGPTVHARASVHAGVVSRVVLGSSHGGTAMKKLRIVR